jgi:DNA-binding NarL/FixJ family response regulator
MKSTILIADDHPLFREALTYIVESSVKKLSGNDPIKEGPLEIIHATDYNETLNTLNENTIDWLFLDLNMPDSNGLSGLGDIKKQYPNLSVIIISANQSQEIIQSCLNHNVSGYITKSTLPDDIEAAIQKIFSGECYSPILNVSSEKNAGSKGIDSLTSAQLNILTHIGLGKLNKQIAVDLGITEATVKAHITQIYKKLNINNRTQAALLATQAQLIN